jgi:hypothetical protein
MFSLFSRLCGVLCGQLRFSLYAQGVNNVFPGGSPDVGRAPPPAIPSISPPAHRLAGFLHKSSTDSCTERRVSCLCRAHGRGGAGIASLPGGRHKHRPRTRQTFRMHISSSSAPISAAQSGLAWPHRATAVCVSARGAVRPHGVKRSSCAGVGICRWLHGRASGRVWSAARDR